MASSVTVAPQNSLISIADDPQTAEVRLFEPGKRIVAAPSCIVLGVLNFQDGPTTITLGPPPKTSARPIFDGVLETPRHHVSVWTIEWKKLLETRVPTSRTKIRIWANHPTEPDEVLIAVGD